MHFTRQWERRHQWGLKWQAYLIKKQYAFCCYDCWLDSAAHLDFFTVFFLTHTHALWFKCITNIQDLCFSSTVSWHCLFKSLTCFTHLIFTVSQQFKDVHLQLASGRAVTALVDVFFGQSDGQAFASAALHRIIKDGSWVKEKVKYCILKEVIKKQERSCIYLQCKLLKMPPNEWEPGWNVWLVIWEPTTTFS